MSPLMPEKGSKYTIRINEIEFRFALDAKSRNWI